MGFRGIYHWVTSGSTAPNLTEDHGSIFTGSIEANAGSTEIIPGSGHNITTDIVSRLVQPPMPTRQSLQSRNQNRQVRLSLRGGPRQKLSRQAIRSAQKHTKRGAKGKKKSKKGSKKKPKKTKKPKKKKGKK